MSWTRWWHSVLMPVRHHPWKDHRRWYRQVWLYRHLPRSDDGWCRCRHWNGQTSRVCIRVQRRPWRWRRCGWHRHKWPYPHRCRSGLSRSLSRSSVQYLFRRMEHAALKAEPPVFACWHPLRHGKHHRSLRTGYMQQRQKRSASGKRLPVQRRTCWPIRFHRLFWQRPDRWSACRRRLRWPGRWCSHSHHQRKDKCNLPTHCPWRRPCGMASEWSHIHWSWHRLLSRKSDRCSDLPGSRSDRSCRSESCERHGLQSLLFLWSDRPGPMQRYGACWSTRPEGSADPWTGKAAKKRRILWSHRITDGYWWVSSELRFRSPWWTSFPWPPFPFWKDRYGTGSEWVRRLSWFYGCPAYRYHRWNRRRRAAWTYSCRMPAYRTSWCTSCCWADRYRSVWSWRFHRSGCRYWRPGKPYRLTKRKSFHPDRLWPWSPLPCRTSACSCHDPAGSKASPVRHRRSHRCRSCPSVCLIRIISGHSPWPLRNSRKWAELPWQWCRCRLWSSRSLSRSSRHHRASGPYPWNRSCPWDRCRWPELCRSKPACRCWRLQRWSDVRRCVWTGRPQHEYPWPVLLLKRFSPPSRSWYLPYRADFHLPYKDPVPERDVQYGR